MSRVQRYLAGLAERITNPDAIPLYYFSEVPNVGDLLSPYIVSRVSGRPVYRMRSGRITNLCAIGSILGAAGPKSHVWGSGSIDGAPLGDRVDPARIHALRGRKTLELVRRKFDVPERMPLGDPALLTPRYFRPRAGVSHRYGIIPHVRDLDLVDGLLKRADGHAMLVDVRKEPEAFITDLVSCEMVLSSSLHGLILADAYGIPNVWAVFSDRLRGASFKFEDYYSTTDTPDRRPLSLPGVDDEREWLSETKARADVSRYLLSGEELVDSFPEVFRSPAPEAHQTIQGGQ